LQWVDVAVGGFFGLTGAEETIFKQASAARQRIPIDITLTRKEKIKKEIE
jgi:hypothetical protein